MNVVIKWPGGDLLEVMLRGEVEGGMAARTDIRRRGKNESA